MQEMEGIEKIDGDDHKTPFRKEGGLFTKRAMSQASREEVFATSYLERM